MAREPAIKAIHETMFGLQGKLIFLQEQYSVYHDNYSPEAMELVGVAEAYNKAVSAAYENNEFDNLSDSELDEMVDLSRQVSQLYELGVDFSAADTVVVNDDSFWKIYKNKDNAIIRVEYGQNAASVQIINHKGQIEKTVQRRTDLGGFSRSLLEAAGEEDYNNAKKIEMIETIMLDDGLFYINKEEGWVTKESYFARMTAKDFLSIQDYKDITVKAVYDDSKGELTFTYTAGGKTENLFVIEASNNQWKAKNVLPSIELVAKLARFMNVSLDWLVYGENPETTLSENTAENPYSRKSILYRIETVLLQNNEDYDYELKSLHEKYLSDIIEYEVLINWVNGKSYISEEALPKIAKKLNVTLQWLLTKDEYHQQDVDAYLFGLAKAYSGLVKGYDCLNEQDKRFIDSYIQTKLDYRRLKSKENTELQKKTSKG